MFQVHLQTLLPVAFGGAIGAVLRHGTGLALLRVAGPAAWPWWLILVNVAGSFLIGALWAALQDHRISQDWAPFLMTGVLGGFTTFSAFSLDTMRLIEDGRIVAASGYVLASVVLSIGAAAAGLWIVRGAAG